MDAVTTDACARFLSFLNRERWWLSGNISEQRVGIIVVLPYANTSGLLDDLELCPNGGQFIQLLIEESFSSNVCLGSI